MRRFFTWMVFGAFTGGVVSTLAAPFVLQTLLASTGARDALCQCLELVNNTSSLLIKTQVWGVIIGAVLFPTGAWITKRLWARRKARKAVPPAGTPTPPTTPSGPA